MNAVGATWTRLQQHQTPVTLTGSLRYPGVESSFTSAKIRRQAMPRGGARLHGDLQSRRGRLALECSVIPVHERFQLFGRAVFGSNFTNLAPN